ncbi:MAG: dUTP diphosphatase [Rickettsiales bacterium]|nr:dUTP diphosphatase [Pseudomonadota bacterium]MDA0966561.1 dUTP diphosphatase [Pseudomonadota bacterium]MDG4543590.1 dUTP diphosphatase [Rickettsiales bacterium]MDG4545737.1 dUTP diphosphatase [Rickettsiales bacterium]MDG4547490.1 dUTP diphosphatase [Rickettsiales bacterium]
MTIIVEIKQLENAQGLDLPYYATEHSAGMDLQAAIAEDITLKPNQRAIIKCGISIALPDGYEAQIRPRSGLAYKNGITVLNAPGTIDADYRGEVGVILVNLGEESFTISRGDRIAQMIIAPYIKADLQVVTELSETVRGAGGFGSTGLKEAS